MNLYVIFLNFIVLFLAVQGLNCCSGFSVVVGSRAPLHWSARASRSSFSCHGAWALGKRTSVVVAHGASLLHGMWNLPGPGIKPVPLALAGRFLSTEPPGKSWAGTFLLDWSYGDTSALPLLGPDKCLKIKVSWALFYVLWRCSITGAHLGQIVAYSFLLDLLTHIELFVDPWTITHQAPLSLGFPRREYWSG